KRDSKVNLHQTHTLFKKNKNCEKKIGTISVFDHADPKTFKQHFESKHPKSPMVPVLVDVQA
uniref:Uncharacterized protein n=1 Tax=Oncorhynchus mykiss TaxID=8022 RepID=A0A8C7NP24_ONCMY